MNQLTPFEAPEQITKEAIQQYADVLIDQLEAGHSNTLDVALKIKFMEELIEKIKDRLRSMVVDELDKYQKGEECVRYNASFKAKESGVRYDFHPCNDPKWSGLTQSINELTEKRKERELFLKSIKEKTTFVDDETGEIVNIFPARKLSTTTYEIRWKK
jgi:hypothetical protein